MNAAQHLQDDPVVGRSCDAGCDHAPVLHLSKSTDPTLHHSCPSRRARAQETFLAQFPSVWCFLSAAMLPFKRTFDSEKQQLQELNSRLVQYLSRTKQLEQENARLITEISHLKQVKQSPERPQNYRAETRDLRRMVEQLAFEKSQAELEREKLWRELQTLQSACSEQSVACRDISGELRGCEQELQQAHKVNGELQQRLLQLQNECKRVEEAHRRSLQHLHRQVDSRVAPIVTQTYRGPPAVSVEEVQEYARGLSEGWIETFEMYQRKVEEMERAIQEDQARMSDMKTEKMMYASELGKLRTETERQAQIQRRLEEQLMDMQQKFQLEFNEYQVRKSEKSTLSRIQNFNIFSLPKIHNSKIYSKNKTKQFVFGRLSQK